MCTIVAMLRPNGEDRLLFLENHDKVDAEYLGEDVRIIEGNRVVALFDYRSKGIVCGYSLEAGIFGGVANVPGFKGSMSRGVLLREVLSGSKGLSGAIETIEVRLRSGLYGSANYVLGDMEGLFRIESLGGRLYISAAKDSLVVTNRFRDMDFKPEKDFHQRIIENSLMRESYIQTYIQGKGLTLGDFLRIATHHGKEVSVCRHGGSDTLTLSSVIFHVKEGRPPKILYSIGNPCENQYKEFIA